MMRTHFLAALFSHLKEYGFDIILFIAGLAGGIAVLTKSNKLTRLQKFGTVLSGGFTANYMTPVVAEWLNLSEKTLYGLAFLLGYGGLKFVETLFVHVQGRFPAAVVNNLNNDNHGPDITGEN